MKKVPPTSTHAPTTTPAESGWWQVRHTRMSNRLLEAAWHHDGLRHWLACRPQWLVADHQVLLADILVRMTEAHLLPRLLDLLGENASRMEPILWRLAERHLGGRLWRNRLWQVADRAVWSPDQWRCFAVLCGCTGDLTRDVARQAGIQEETFSRWWGPPPKIGPPPPINERLERRARLLSQLRLQGELDVLSLAEQEGQALSLLELGHPAPMHRLLAQPPWTYQPLLARTAPIVQRLRDRLALRFHAWLLATPARWTHAKPGLVRQQLLLLRGLPARVPANQWEKLQLKPAVLAHMGAAARERAPLRRRDIYLALQQVREADQALDRAALGAASWNLLLTLVPPDPQEAGVPSSAGPTPGAPSAT